jgi:hypothetical protein
VSPAGRRVDGRRGLSEVRAAVAERLRDRSEEICEAVVHRALSVAPPSGREAPGYVEALRAAIPAAVEHAFGAIELGEERVGPTPAAIFVQAAASARSEVGLEAVMRRYAAGYSTISDFLHQEAGAIVGAPPEFQTVAQRDLTSLFDRFVAEVAETYQRTERRRAPTQEERRLKWIGRLMAGDMIDPGGLDHPVEGTNLAVIVSGPGHQAVGAALARSLDRRALFGERSFGRSVVWLGGSRPIEEDDLGRVLADAAASGVRLSLGESGVGLVGWRRTRRQAEAAFMVAERSQASIVRYRDIALLAAALRDPDLSYFLHETYVEPLKGVTSLLGQTMLAVIESAGNHSSAGALLGIPRQTVTSRVAAAERRIGRQATNCGPQLATALQLARLSG